MVARTRHRVGTEPLADKDVPATPHRGMRVSEMTYRASQLVQQVSCQGYLSLLGGMSRPVRCLTTLLNQPVKDCGLNGRPEARFKNACVAWSPDLAAMLGLPCCNQVLRLLTNIASQSSIANGPMACLFCLLLFL